MDIAKYGVKLSNVFDPRLVVNEPVYRCFRGPNDVSIEKVTPTANSTTQLQFLYNSSPSFFLDRHFIVSGSFILQCKVILNNKASTAITINSAVTPLVWGSSVSTCAFPFHELMTSASLEINNCKTDINYQQYKNLLLRLTGTQNNMKIRGCPSYMDTTANYDDCYLAKNNPLSGYNDADPLSGAIGNGSFNNFTYMFLSGTGLREAQSGDSIAIINPGGGAVNITFNGTNWVLAANSVLQAQSYVNLLIQINYREPCLTPLSIFDDAREFINEGLHNVQTLQLSYTVNSGTNRVLRNCSKASPITDGTTTGYCVIGDCVLYGNPSPVFANAELEITRLTPPINTEAYSIPRISLIPSTKFEMLTGSSVATLTAGNYTVLNTSSVAISGIPDFMIIFARCNSYNNIANAPFTEADWYCPITNLQIEWQGATSLMNTLGPEDLYDLSARNGLQMPFLEALGSANRLQPSISGNSIVMTNANVALVGAPVVIRPVYDWGAGGYPMAPGLGGSFTLRVTATVNNYNTFSANNVYLYCACVYGGYFVTDGPNSSTFFKNVLTYRDLESVSQNAPSVSMDTLSRFVGGGMHERMSHMIARPRHIHHHGHHERASSVPAERHHEGPRKRLG